MHEFGITSRIVDTVLQAAVENNSTRVLEVELVIGRLTFLNPQQVQYAYQLLVQGTIMDGSKLIIEETEGAVCCKTCHAVNLLKLPPHGCFDPFPSFSCPDCGGSVELVRGKECLVKGAKMV